MNSMYQRAKTLMGQAQDRRGTILVLAAISMIMMLAFVAFSVDVGYIALTRGQLQNVADAAALAAAMELNSSNDPATVRTNAGNAAVEVARANLGSNPNRVFVDPGTDIQFGQQSYNLNTNSYDTNWGNQFTPYNIVRVTTSHESRMSADGKTTDNRTLPLFFAPVLGNDSASITTSAVATFQERDIAIVLDYSGSMNDDSELKSINVLGRDAVEANLRQIYGELGSPVYGTMKFNPEWATVSGQPASGNIPHIDVTWKGTEVSAVSTKALSNVVLKFSNGKTQTFSSLSNKTGSFKGSGSNNGKDIVTAWIKSGSNSSSDGKDYGERFDFNSTGLKKALGLDKVAYPYPAGSWDEYISYCTASGGQPDDAGYRNKFGYMTLVNYWLESRESYAETPDLWKTSEQPIASLKSAVNIFIDYLNDVGATDRVGLSVYTHSSSAGAFLESRLTRDLDVIKTISTQRQAGHYTAMTNIGAGMKVARQELTSGSRPNALKLMVLMTDGLPNQPGSVSTATAFALQEADLAAAAKIKIVTVSVGAGADTSLMQSIADKTGGVHFNVPGGASVETYKAQLENVFREIAADRPLKLIYDAD